MGADDYMTKPFSLDEVRARIRLAMRHHLPKVTSSTLTLSDLELDTSARTARRRNRSLELRRKEFDLLEYMMRNQGKTLTRPMILEHIWDMNENLWANVVDVHIKHLRDKIDRPYGSQMIKTVHGVGYKLEA
jgi:two-component system OmpR family response regulator